MTTLPPPPHVPPGLNTVLGSNRVGIRLTGINPSSRAEEFTAQLAVSVGSVDYHPERRFGVDEALDLRIAVSFPNRQPIQVSARIAGFLSIALHLLSPTSLEAHIEHALSAKKKCHLICFENGTTSDGPCLTCPDGAYQVRICC